MKRLILSAAAVLFLAAGQAAADGLPSRSKTKASVSDARPCSLVAETGVSFENATRGFGESNQAFSVEGGVMLTCGRFYAAVEGTSVSIEGATAEVDLSMGINPKTGPITWDFGLIFHTYNHAASLLNFLELKAGASAEIWRGGTLEATALYSPEYGGLVGNTRQTVGTAAWTFEGIFAQTLPDVGIFSPTVTGAVGQVNFEGGAGDYVYWYVGVTLDFRENWSVEIRYTDTDVAGGCGGICNERVMASVRYTF